MPRKTAILKITAGDKVPKDLQWQIDSLKRFTPVAGTEEQYDRYVTSVVMRYKQSARFDQACDLHDKHLSDESRALMNKEGAEYSKLISIELRYLDLWRNACLHVDDLVAVPESEVRNVVIMSMSDKLDGLDFNLNHGLLSSKVAQAIRKDVTEFEFDPPLCQEHS